MVWLSFLTSISVGTAYYFLNPMIADDKQIQMIAGAMATIEGTLFGFLITALSIMTSVMNSRLLVEMRKTGHFARMVHELFLCSASFFVGMILSLACLFFTNGYLRNSMVVSVTVFSFSSAMVVFAGYHFYLVLSRVK